MGLFSKKKEKEVCGCGCNQEGCSCGGNCNAENQGAYIKVLGSGCKKCNELEANTVEALKQLGMDTAIEHVTDFAKIATYGVMQTPALVAGEKVISYGKVLKTEEVVELLKKL